MRKMKKIQMECGDDSMWYETMVNNNTNRMNEIEKFTVKHVKVQEWSNAEKRRASPEMYYLKWLKVSPQLLSFVVDLLS
jgi:hypothetical protein